MTSELIEEKSSWVKQLEEMWNELTKCKRAKHLIDLHLTFIILAQCFIAIQKDRVDIKYYQCNFYCIYKNRRNNDFLFAWASLLQLLYFFLFKPHSLHI